MCPMVKERAQDSPKDMPAIQYAGWLLENRLAIPKSKSLLEIIELAIKSIAASKFREEKWKHPEFTAFVWLDRQCGFAQERGIKINSLFFMNGDYNDVEPAQKKLAPFIPCDQCSFGWVPQMKDGQSTGRVVACECRKRWCEEAKVQK